ncbi:MAG: hypothetical protein ACK5CL_01315 [Sphingomonadales bacterium]
MERNITPRCSHPAHFCADFVFGIALATPGSTGVNGHQKQHNATGTDD